MQFWSSKHDSWPTIRYALFLRWSNVVRIPNRNCGIKIILQQQQAALLLVQMGFRTAINSNNHQLFISAV